MLCEQTTANAGSELTKINPVPNVSVCPSWQTLIFKPIHYDNYLANQPIAARAALFFWTPDVL